MGDLETVLASDWGYLGSWPAGTEEINYIPRSGAARKIQAEITEDQEQEDTEFHRRFVLRALVTVARDEQSATGGIDDPAIGDVIERAGGKRYSFTGVRQDIGSVLHRLEFQSVKVVQFSREGPE